MSTHGSKGSVLSLTMGGALTPLAQVLSLDAGDVATETYEADYLDNPSAGIPYAPTGRVEPGKISGELFLDFSSSTTPTTLYAALALAPASTGIPGTLSLGGSSSSTRNGLMTFVAAGCSLGLTLALKDGQKGKFSLKLSGLPVFTA